MIDIGLKDAIDLGLKAFDKLVGVYNDERLVKHGEQKVQLKGLENLADAFDIAGRVEQEVERKLRERGIYDDGYRRD